MKILYRKKMIRLTAIHYGLLYNRYVISDPRGIAPAGWHIPTQAEYDTLFTFLGGISVAGTPLKEAGSLHWNPVNTGNNNTGFTSVGSSFRENTGVFNTALKIECRVWNSTDYTGTMGRFTRLGYDILTEVTNVNLAYKEFGFALRLIKNDTNDPGTLTDIEDNVYGTVKIGNQVFTKSNFICKHYINGDLIPNVTVNATWAGLTSGAWCAYNNNPANM